ncbi:MAG: electron transfer flavoprotein subunit alpha/FixB family protein [bacterium]
MPNCILFFAEQRDGKLRKVAFEVARASKSLADDVGAESIAAVVGSGVGKIASSLGEYGADRVLVAEDETFRNYSPDGYCRALVEMIRRCKPDVVLLPASSMGRDLAPRVAANLEAGLLSDCIDLKWESGKLQAKRPIYAGKLIATVVSDSSPQIATLRPNIFPAERIEGRGSAPTEDVAVGLENLREIVKDVVETESKLDLTEARVIVAGGRGVQSPENFRLLEELAEVLGGAVGASRAAVDAGWRPHADQVGQTGKTVSPDLYIACGISGSIQHLAGIMGAKCIVAINKDPDAPIFKVANYGVVGDLFRVVPALTEEFRRILG